VSSPSELTATLEQTLVRDVLLHCTCFAWLSLSVRRPGFDFGLDRVGFVIDKVTLGQVFSECLIPSPVSIIPPVLHTH